MEESDISPLGKMPNRHAYETKAQQTHETLDQKTYSVYVTNVLFK